MLRVQRECGKSREGASVPMCIKLQGAVLCGKPQHQNNEAGCTNLTDSQERSDARDKTEGSHSERHEQSSGKLFSLKI